MGVLDEDGDECDGGNSRRMIFATGDVTGECGESRVESPFEA